MKGQFYKRLLNTIERLCYIYYDEDSPKRKKDAEKIMDNIYRLSHLASNCGHPHSDWREWFLKLEKELKDK